MKCINCPLCTYYNDETMLEPEIHCLLGKQDEDDGMVQFKDGNIGCKIPWNKADKIAKEW